MSPYEIELAQYAEDSVSEPFLPTMKTTAGCDRRRIRKLEVLVYALASGILFLSLLVLKLLWAVPAQSSTRNEGQIYSPAEHLIRNKYVEVVFSSGFGTERTAYQGPPSPERNALWDDLYGFGISRIPRESAAKLTNKTVPIPGDSGYYAVQLNVFHQLHCLNMLRKRLYDDQLYPPDHELMGIEHLEHCYDALRQSLMCSADITPLPWQWVEADQEAKEVARVAHTCRDFDAVWNWGKENAVKNFDRHTFVPDDLQD